VEDRVFEDPGGRGHRDQGRRRFVAKVAVKLEEELLGALVSVAVQIFSATAVLEARLGDTKVL
jgi:hypothetical protein